MNITIRQAHTGDAALIADLSRQTFYDTFAVHNTKEDMDQFLREQFSRESLMAEVGAPGNTFLLAYVGETIAGYARLREGANPRELDDLPALEISRIYLSKNFIGGGVGKALMHACIDLARAKGKQLIWLGVWENNSRAIAFYTKWGFEKFSEHDFLLGSDVQRDWLMKKTV